MSPTIIIDVCARPGAAITALCTFGETVKTHAGSIEPTAFSFILHREGHNPREFPTASGAVEVLRRLSTAQR